MTPDTQAKVIALQEPSGGRRMWMLSCLLGLGHLRRRMDPEVRQLDGPKSGTQKREK